MASISEQGTARAFELRMLIYDTRYRSMTIQVIAFILLMAAAAWLVSNVVSNLAAQDKDFDFGFLGTTAGYEVEQTLIPYNSSDSSHGRAAIVGLLNTLLVAAMGCITATVLGVFIGVLRLSKNWLVSRLMAVYIEGFRNVPLLLWILVFVAIFDNVVPIPRTYLPNADTGIAESTMLFGSIAFTNQGTFVPRLVYAETAWIVAIGLALAIGASIAIRRINHRHQMQTGERRMTLLPVVGAIVVLLGGSYLLASSLSRGDEIVLIAATPNGETSVAELAAEERVDFCRRINDAKGLVVQRALVDEGADMRAIQYYGYTTAERAFARGNCQIFPVLASEAPAVIAELQPQMRGDVPISVLSQTYRQGGALMVESPAPTGPRLSPLEGGIQISNGLLALWLALSLYTGAFIAEIVRAGIQSVSKGQTEAASALGLRPNRTMSLVILPQALRVIIPPSISQFLNLTKNSSLAIASGYSDLRATLGGITVNQTGRELEGMLMMMLCYLIISLSIAAVGNLYNASVKLKER